MPAVALPSQRVRPIIKLWLVEPWGRCTSNAVGLERGVQTFNGCRGNPSPKGRSPIWRRSANVWKARFGICRNAWRGRGISLLAVLSWLKGRVCRATRTERRHPLDAGIGTTRATACPAVPRVLTERKSLPCGGSRIPCFPCIRPGDPARPDARCAGPPPTWPPWCRAVRGTLRRGRS